jgi:hypothetical protein
LGPRYVWLKKSGEKEKEREEEKEKRKEDKGQCK